jgi:hypothetical protein
MCGTWMKQADEDTKVYPVPQKETQGKGTVVPDFWKHVDQRLLSAPRPTVSSCLLVLRLLSPHRTSCNPLGSSVME